MTAHLGPAATELVDGELDHDRRDEVLTHLAHCSECRAEVEHLRRVKSALRIAPGPTLPTTLGARLLAAGLQPGPPPPPARVHPLRRVPPRLRRTAVGGALLAVSVGGAFSLAGPPPAAPPARVDPASQRFVVDHASTAGEVPFTEPPAVSGVARTVSGPAR